MNLANTIHSLRQLPPDQVLAKATQVLPPWVTLVLVVAVAWKVAQLTWLVWPAAADLPLAAIPEPATGSAPSAVAGGVDIASVARAHLFGQPPAAPVVKRDPTDLEEYKGRLELSGTIAADDPKDARAIISDPGGDENVYAIKEAVPDGSTLHAVYADQVVLSRNGELTRLELPRDFKSQPSSRRQSRRTTASRSRTRATNLRDAIAQNPTQLTDIIRPTPYHDQGKLRGYRVYPGRERQKFSRLGLRPGDIVTSINGMALDDPARGIEIFQSLGTATQASITVERNGQQQTLIISAEQLGTQVRGRSTE